MNILETIKENAGINEMAVEDFRGPVGLEKAKSTIQAVLKNLQSGKKSSKDFTAILQSAKKALVQDNAVKNKAYAVNADKALALIKSGKDKLGSQQTRIDTTKVGNK